MITRTLLLLAVLASSLTLVPDRASADTQEKIVICHRTNSRTNPYNQQAVAVDSVVDGHGSHTGPVFGPDVDHWGDIIPPVKPGLPDGLNWDAAGRDVLDNGCELPPDPGPIPGASIGDVACSGATPTVSVTVSNAADATDPATFTIRVNGATVQTVGPVAPGDSRTVTLTGAPEDTVAVIEVLSGGKVIDGSVVTADCAPGPPPVELQAGFGCAGDTAEGELTITDNTPDPIDVALQVDGVQIGPTITVAPGATETRTIDASRWEDRTVTARVLVDGVVVATYRVTPDCAAPDPEPSARLVGTVCPPPLATVSLTNDGDPDSSVVFGIRVDGRPVQRSAPVYGGDTTTIVVDLSRFEDQTVHVQAGYDGTLLVDRRVKVDCVTDTSGGSSGGGSGGGTSGGQETGAGALPSVGSAVPAGVAVAGIGCVLAGTALLVAGARTRRPARR